MKKTKNIATLIASFVVFAATFFALAQGQNGNSLFLDSDQDGLTDQEERMIGTDPGKADTDGDGYSDGKEIESGYDPTKPAPGDKIIAQAQPAASESTGDQAGQSDLAAAANPDQTGSDLLSQLTGETGLSASDSLTDLSSDPNNPNITNEMIGQLMQLTTQKAGDSETFAQNPTYTAEDLDQISRSALETVDITKDFPEIADGELNILPEIKGKNLSEDEIKEKQKNEIEKYLAQSAFIFASNSPFAVENMSSLQTNLNTEGENLVSALVIGDSAKIDSYAQKAQTGIDQMKKIEVPYVLKDIHKSMLQLAICTVGLKDDISASASDPMKGLLAASSLTAVAENAVKLQDEFSGILSEYGIESVNFP